MISFKQAYYYSFYKLFKSFEASPSKFWSEWKASLLMDILLGCIIIDLGLGYTLFTKKAFIIFESNLYTWIMIIAVSVTNYFIFNHSDKWKEIIVDFDRWPKHKNRVGSIIFWSFFIVLIASVITMFYFLSQINWQQFR